MVKIPYKTKEDKKQWAKERRQKFRQFIDEEKKTIGKCQRCGYDKFPELCDFHHEHDKNFKINRNAATRNFDKIKEEMDQCILLCKNCHAEEHKDDWFNGRNQFNIRE